MKYDEIDLEFIVAVMTLNGFQVQHEGIVYGRNRARDYIAQTGFSEYDALGHLKSLVIYPNEWFKEEK